MAGEFPDMRTDDHNPVPFGRRPARRLGRLVSPGLAVALAMIARAAAGGGDVPLAFTHRLEAAPVSKGVVQEFALADLASGSGQVRVRSSNTNAVHATISGGVLRLRYAWKNANTAKLTMTLAAPASGTRVVHRFSVNRAFGRVAIVGQSALTNDGTHAIQTLRLENRTGTTLHGVRVMAAGLGRLDWMINRTGLDPVRLEPVRDIPCHLPPGSQRVVRVVYDSAYMTQALAGRPAAYEVRAILKPAPVRSRIPQKIINGQNYELVWKDEFKATSLNRANWNVWSMPRKDGYWIREAVSVADGALRLKATRRGDCYRSGAISTQGKFAFQYGYFEARVRFAREAGHYFCFWLFPDTGFANTIVNSSVDGAEIDIAEKNRNDNSLWHCIHWDGYETEHKVIRAKINMPGLSAGYHTVGLLWKPDRYEFFVDGQRTRTVTASDTQGICQVPLCMVLSDEFLRSWSGDPSQSLFPDSTRVDYVRVYHGR